MEPEKWLEHYRQYACAILGMASSNGRLAAGWLAAYALMERGQVPLVTDQLVSVVELRSRLDLLMKSR